jgi:hypothetical protein
MPGYLAFKYFTQPQGIIPADLDGEDLEQVLATWLKQDEAVASIVGPRVYPITVPKSASTPLLVYRMISGSGEHDLRGYIGISRARIRITARSKRLRDCARLRDAVRQLDGFQGYFGVVRVEFCKFEDVEDDYDEPEEGSDDGTYERKFDLNFRYRESIPIN